MIHVRAPHTSYAERRRWRAQAILATTTCGAAEAIEATRSIAP